MILRLPRPETNIAQFVDAIVAERQSGANKAFFNSIHIEWRDRASFYVESSGNPEQVPTWPHIADRSATFINLYEHPAPTSVQKPLIAGLRSRKLNVCPFCGEEGTPNTLDHYLPKSVYPHLSMIPENLVPMCDICQDHKDVTALDAHGLRVFVHPYFDQCADRTLLELAIGRPLNAPEGFVLQVDHTLPVPTRELVERHISALQIGERYESYFREAYVHLLKLAQEARDGGTNVVDHLQAFRALMRKSGANVWPFIFYDAVCRDAELQEYLAVGELPTYL